jgi:hypothetical protein
MRHFRGFNIWVPQTASTRVSGTVWWFMKPFEPDCHLLTPENNAILYPSTRHRLHPTDDGSDLLGRCFLEPSLGVCCITRLGPKLDSASDQTFTATLHYRCLSSQAEFYSPVTIIEKWILNGPILPKPEADNTRPQTAPVSYPIFALPSAYNDKAPVQSAEAKMIPSIRQETTPVDAPQSDRKQSQFDLQDTRVDEPAGLRRSQRKRKAPDFL